MVLKQSFIFIKVILKLECYKSMPYIKPFADKKNQSVTWPGQSLTSYAPDLICEYRRCWSSSQKGGYPTKRIYRITPQAQISTGLPYGSFFNTSGLRQPGVPAKPNQAVWSPCTSIARPKSASFTLAPLFLLANNKFSG